LLAVSKTYDVTGAFATTQCFESMIIVAFASFYPIIRDDMRYIIESYGRIGENEDRFDIEFWQQQGDQAIFNAALDMIMDYLLVRYGYVDKPRLQRTVEFFGKMDWIKSKEASGRPQDLIDAKELKKARD